ncbi:hypothetical protein I551_8165 [Mycobacterium ulcerans str. Harvey]|uniref:Uncharacterized protein n=1 Tax=Mycobacterium ulcerans str. Harvey TaxID=1299332 RepID=A0ABN0QL94_MYCUL|nr:hypothetical protein I551_8165 [Mycobacterium ulcerans str. Harvey]
MRRLPRARPGRSAGASEPSGPLVGRILSDLRAPLSDPGDIIRDVRRCGFNDQPGV